MEPLDYTVSVGQFAYDNAGAPVLHQLNLCLCPGQVLALVGPNGCGKSTLLKLLSGELKGTRCHATLHGRALSSWPVPELARRRAVLPQTQQLSFPFEVQEVVALGRNAHPESALDPAGVTQCALEAVGLRDFGPRPYLALSGGERQRVHLARVLAQVWPEPEAAAPRYLLLDEPVNNLDLASQHLCLRLAREQAHRGCGVLLVLHDLNLALRYADQVALMQQGQILERGLPEETLAPAKVTEVFGVRAEFLADAKGRPWLVTEAQTSAAKP